MGESVQEPSLEQMVVSSRLPVHYQHKIQALLFPRQPSCPASASISSLLNSLAFYCIQLGTPGQAFTIAHYHKLPLRKAARNMQTGDS